MSEAALSANVLTLTELSAWAERKGKDLAGMDFTKPFKVCEVMLESETKKNFEGGHSPDGTAWLPLKKPRTRTKGMGAGSDLPLRDKGLLMGSVTAGAGSGAIREIGPHELLFGSGLEYAAIQNFGGTVNIPARTTHILAAPKDLRRKKSRILFAKKTTANMEKRGARSYIAKVGAYSVTIPARPFLGITPVIAERTAEIFGEFVGERLA